MSQKCISPISSFLSWIFSLLFQSLLPFQFQCVNSPSLLRGTTSTTILWHRSLGPSDHWPRRAWVTSTQKKKSINANKKALPILIHKPITRYKSDTLQHAFISVFQGFLCVIFLEMSPKSAHILMDGNLFWNYVHNLTQPQCSLNHTALFLGSFRPGNLAKGNKGFQSPTKAKIAWTTSVLTCLEEVFDFCYNKLLWCYIPKS